MSLHVCLEQAFIIACFFFFLGKWLFRSRASHLFFCKYYLPFGSVTPHDCTCSVDLPYRPQSGVACSLRQSSRLGSWLLVFTSRMDA